MALTETQQIHEAWTHANRVLVCFRHDEKHDGAATSLALARVLRKLGKEVAVVAAGWECPQELKFLPEVETIKPHIEDLQRFVIEIDISKTEHKEVRHEMTDGKLRVVLTPRSGVWSREDVAVRPEAYHFDLICTVGVPDLESLGQLFEKHTDFFYHTPILNIDHSPANERFGQINCIDITCAACGEVLFELCAKIDRHLIDEQTATCMLTGLIGKTRSFKTRTVTPKTLRVASELVAMGAAREDIVHHLYRTRTVPVLRLWGRALARLKHAPEARLVWTLLSKQDFLHAGTEASVLPGVIDELIINAPEACCALILHENQNGDGVVGLLHARRPLNALELTKPFAGRGNHETANFEMNKKLIEAEPLVIDRLKTKLIKMLS